MAIKTSFKKGGKGGKPGKPIAGKIYRKIKNGYVEPKKARVSKGTNVLAMDIISAADLEASESENEGPKGFADFGSEDEGKKEVKKDVKKEVKGKEVVKKGDKKGDKSRDVKKDESAAESGSAESAASKSSQSRDRKLASDDSAVVGALGGSLTGSEELTQPKEKLTKAEKGEKELTKQVPKGKVATEATEDAAKTESKPTAKLTKQELIKQKKELTKQKKDATKAAAKSTLASDVQEAQEEDASAQPKTKKAKKELTKQSDKLAKQSSTPPQPVEITDPDLIPDMNDWSDAEYSDTEGTIEPGKPVNINTLKWTKVDLGDKKMDFEGFYGLEECDGVDVVVNNGMSSFVGAEPKVKKVANKTPNEEIKVKEGKKEAKKAVVKDTEEKQKTVKPAKVAKKAGKAQDNSFAALTTVPDDIHLPDWTLEGEQLHYSLIQGLYALGYKSPTEIQKKSISPILSGDDVIGKASTGSGKTLAYGLPILHRFLTRSKTEKVVEEPEKPVVKKKKMTKQPVEEDDENATMYDEPEKPRFDISDRPKDLPVLNKEKEDRENEVELDAESEKVERDMTNVEPPQAIIFAPTRELAHQITDHLNAVSQFCPISGPRVMSLTGGLSIMKQRRLMKWNPAIVVATPGRFHEFITDTDGMVDVFKRTKTVVMDEADRMLQDGHYEDLDKALDLIGRGKEAKRQTCVFSATFQKSLMFKLDKKRKQKSGLATDNETIRFLVSKMKFRQFHPQFVDANPAEVVARQVLESIVECGAMEKDQYLYYFLLTYPGKSIIFVNSIDSVKRLTPMLQNLQLPAVQLHSNMIQKARMRSLERFRDNENGILVATDVAARGLDIPNVHHVVHYHLPRTADVYVHRSGRTARAGNEGVSVLLCSPDEASGPLRKLRTALSRDNALAKLKPLSLNYDVLAQIKPRVEIAKQLADSVLDSTQVGKQDSWLKEAAEDLGVDFSDFENDSTDHKSHVRTKFGNNSKKGANVMTKGQMDAARRELEKLLSKPLGRHSSKYITSTNGINLAKMVLEGKSHDKIMGVAPATAGETLRKKRRS